MLNALLVVLYAAMPIAIMTSDRVPSPVFYLAIALCLVLLACRKPWTASAVAVPADYKALFLCCGVPVLAVLISSAEHGHWPGGDFESALRWSVGLPVLVLGLARVGRRTLAQAMWGVYIAALAATAYVVYLAYPSLVRPQTEIYNAVSYGNLLLVLAVISLFSLYLPLTSRPRLEHILKVGVAALAFAGFIVTQTRTGWMAMPVFVLLGVALRFGYKRPGRTLGIAIGILVIVLAIGASSASLRQRVETGYTQTLSCHGANETANTSVCIRFQLWQAGEHAFAHNPAFGLGDSGLFRKWMRARALPDGVVSSYVAHNFGEPHNDMIKALYSFGVLGGLGLLLAYFAPAWLFIRRMSHRYSTQTRAAAAMGAAFCLGFAIFGLTELMFRGMRTVSFYTMFVSLFLALSSPVKQGDETGVAHQEAPS